MKKIKEIFEKSFSNWNIKLSNDILKNKKRGIIHCSGWIIKYCFGVENDLNYMDIYSDHRMTDPSQRRIYENGTIKNLLNRRISIELDDSFEERNKIYTREYIINLSKNEQLEYIFFWKTSKDTLDEGCFSQWQETYFTVQNIKYSCAEQFMMAYKADLFDDLKTFEKIINENNPKIIKELGREVKNFNENIWNEKKYNVVVYANWYKFFQNKEFKNILLCTGKNILVEASPYDKIWGVGLPETDKNIINPSNWKGENLLGFALMQVRDSLIRYDDVNKVK